MLTRAMQIVTAPLRLLWRITGKPLHHRLFGIYFEATINRLNSALGDLNELKDQMARLESELEESRSGQDQLDRHIRTVVASYWDATAVTRRLAALEDRLAIAPTESRASRAAGRPGDEPSESAPIAEPTTL